MFMTVSCVTDKPYLYILLYCSVCQLLSVNPKDQTLYVTSLHMELLLVFAADMHSCEPLHSIMTESALQMTCCCARSGCLRSAALHGIA